MNARVDNMLKALSHASGLCLSVGGWACILEVYYHVTSNPCYILTVCVTDMHTILYHATPEA